MKTAEYMAWVTPMSRTRPAFFSKPATSSWPWPNSFTRSAPETFEALGHGFTIWASHVALTRDVGQPSPTKRAGIRKMGQQGEGPPG